MDDNAGEAAGQSQGHGWSSYPLSFPSQPPDIKNWFSSYEYESPEALELVVHPDGDNASETQDPFEHLPFKHSIQDGGVALRENRLVSQSEAEVFAGKYSVPVDGSAIKPATKRKQSLRTLFGVNFFDEVKEVTEAESQGLFPEQQNALEPMSDCPTSLPDSAKQSQEDAIEHSKVLVDFDRISSLDTQESTPADQEVESKTHVNCDDAHLAHIGEGFAEDVFDQIELPIICNGTNLAGTEKSTEDSFDHGTRLLSHNSVCLTDTGENPPPGETGHCKLSQDSKRPQELVTSDGFIAIKRNVVQPEEWKTNKILRHPISREKEREILPENDRISEQKVLVTEQTRRPLADRTNFSEVTTVQAPELIRKWKCPRKGKPYVGRPLKQLRLEQWVRRLN